MRRLLFVLNHIEYLEYIYFVNIIQKLYKSIINNIYFSAIKQVKICINKSKCRSHTLRLLYKTACNFTSPIDIAHEAVKEYTPGHQKRAFSDAQKPPTNTRSEPFCAQRAHETFKKSLNIQFSRRIRFRRRYMYCCSLQQEEHSCLISHDPSDRQTDRSVRFWHVRFLYVYG